MSAGADPSDGGSTPLGSTLLTSGKSVGYHLSGNQSPVSLRQGVVGDRLWAPSALDRTAVVDSVSIELVHGLVEGMVQVMATFVPPARELEALGALYDWQASLLHGVVRL